MQTDTRAALQRHPPLADGGKPGADLASLDLLADRLGTPTLFLSLEMVRERFQELAAGLPGLTVNYAMKANSATPVLELLHQEGGGFEISSEAELVALLSLGVSPERIASSHPLKAPSFIKTAWEAGVRLFAFDSIAEVDKLAALAPGSHVYVRLNVSNEGSEWPLARKFGVDAEEALRLLHYAQARGLRSLGIAFHVGSQCGRPQTWRDALETASRVWKEASRSGLEMSLLNIGGGFPTPYTKPLPPLADFTAAVQEGLAAHFPSGIHVVTEPGRFLVGEAGVLATAVVAKAQRGDQRWLYFDVGVFNGLMEALGGIRYPMQALRDGEALSWVLAGPSCDSFDVIAENVELPDLAAGDKVFILSAGAYTTVYGSTFNGFPIPTTHFLEGRCP